MLRDLIGAYHSGDPSASDVDLSALSGCALAIADVDDIEKGEHSAVTPPRLRD